MFAVHNLAYQGVFPEQSFDVLGIPREFFSRFHLEEVDTFGRRQTINVMKAALCTADRLITVSTGYASEILTPKFGCGLQSILAKVLRLETELVRLGPFLVSLWYLRLAPPCGTP